MLKQLMTIVFGSIFMGCAYRQDHRPFAVCPDSWTADQVEAITDGFRLWEAREMHFEIILTCDGTDRGIFNQPAYGGAPASYEEMSGNVSLDLRHPAYQNMVTFSAVVAHEIAHCLTEDHNPENGNMMSAILGSFVPTESDVRWIRQYGE